MQLSFSGKQPSGTTTSTNTAGRETGFLVVKNAGNYIQTSNQMMLSSKYGITPYQEQSSAFQQDCEEILNHIPLLLDFQKDTIRRTVFAQRNPKGVNYYL